jgi:hypothetical protein
MTIFQSKKRLKHVKLPRGEIHVKREISRIKSFSSSKISSIAASKSDFQKSKINIAHLNICSLKKREHLIQVRLLMQENKFDICPVGMLAYGQCEKRRGRNYRIQSI